MPREAGQNERRPLLVQIFELAYKNSTSEGGSVFKVASMAHPLFWYSLVRQSKTSCAHIEREGMKEAGIEDECRVAFVRDREARKVTSLTMDV
jgi:hypothetical protein